MIPVDDVFKGVGVRIKLKTRDDFLKVCETLTRMGVASRHEKALYQSCHILHKKGQYAIVHFKELFKLDGKPANITEEDIARRNTIANILSEWGLVELVDAKKSQSPIAAPNQIKIIPYKEKPLWKLVAKYNIGGKKLH